MINQKKKMRLTGILCDRLLQKLKKVLKFTFPSMTLLRMQGTQLLLLMKIKQTSHSTNYSTRLAETKVISNFDVVLFEGILAFYHQEHRNLMDMKLFVDTDADIRLARRGS